MQVFNDEIIIILLLLLLQPFHFHAFFSISNKVYFIFLKRGKKAAKREVFFTIR